MFYTGVSHAEDGLVQRIGLACSDDLLTWEKVAANPLVTADPRWYERLDPEVWVDETCRDPWVFADPDGEGFHMVFTARVNSGPPDGRGALGHARSRDLLHWEVHPPLATPGDFGHLEVPQVVQIGAWHYVVFCVYEWAHAATRLARAPAVGGTHYLIGRSPLGPFELPGDDFLSATPHGAFYAGKVLETAAGWVFMSWAQFGAVGLHRAPRPAPCLLSGSTGASTLRSTAPAPTGTPIGRGAEEASAHDGPCSRRRLDRHGAVLPDPPPPRSG